MCDINFIEHQKEFRKTEILSQLDTLHTFDSITEETTFSTQQLDSQLLSQMSQTSKSKQTILDKKGYSTANFETQKKCSSILTALDNAKKNVCSCQNDLDFIDSQGNKLNERTFVTWFDGFKTNKKGEPENSTEKRKKAEITAVIQDFTSKDAHGKFDLSKREKHLAKMTKEILNIHITKEMLTESYILHNLKSLMSIAYKLNYFENIVKDPINKEYFDRFPLIKEIIEIQHNSSVENSSVEKELMDILLKYFHSNGVKIDGKTFSEIHTSDIKQFEDAIDTLNRIDERKEEENEQNKLQSAYRKQLNKDIEDFKTEYAKNDENEMQLPFLGQHVNSEIAEVRLAFSNNYMNYQQKKELLDLLYNDYYGSMHLYSKSQGDIQACLFIIEKYRTNEVFDAYNEVAALAEEKRKTEESNSLKLHTNLQAMKELLLFILADDMIITDNILSIAQQKGIEKLVQEIQEKRQTNQNLETEEEQEVMDAVCQYNIQQLQRANKTKDTEQTTSKIQTTRANEQILEELNQYTTWEETEETQLRASRTKEAEKWISNWKKLHPEAFNMSDISELGYAYANKSATGTPVQEEIVKNHAEQNQSATVKTTKRKSWKEYLQNLADTVKARWHNSFANHVSYRLHGSISFLNKSRKNALTKEQELAIKNIKGNVGAVKGFLTGMSNNKQREQTIINAFSSNNITNRIGTLKALTDEILKMKFDISMLDEDNIDDNIIMLKLDLDKMKSFSEIMKDPINKSFFDNLPPYTKELLENRMTDRYKIIYKLLKLKLGAKGIDLETGDYLSEKKTKKYSINSNAKIQKYSTHLNYNNQKEAKIFPDFYNKQKKIAEQEYRTVQELENQMDIRENIQSKKGWAFTSYAMARTYQYFEEIRNLFVKNSVQYHENKEVLNKLYQQLYRLIDIKGDYDLETTVLATLQKNKDNKIADKASTELAKPREENAIIDQVIGDLEYLIKFCLGIYNTQADKTEKDIMSIAKEFGYYSELLPLIQKRKLEKNAIVHNKASELFGITVNTASTQLNETLKPLSSIPAHYEESFTSEKENSFINLNNRENLEKIYWTKVLDVICGFKKQTKNILFVNTDKNGVIQQLLTLNHTKSTDANYLVSKNFLCIPESIHAKIKEITEDQLKEQFKTQLNNTELTKMVERFRLLQLHLNHIIVYDLTKQESLAACAKYTVL